MGASHTENCTMGSCIRKVFRLLARGMRACLASALPRYDVAMENCER